MRIVYINPNATRSMTDGIVKVARAALPDARITGLTNVDGPPSIEGAGDGEAALPGVLALLDQAESAGAAAIVIACFDDTGLEEARRAAACPVLGIGQASYTMAGLWGRRFSVITSQEVSVPVIEDNIARQGFAAHCASVRAVGLPVLTIDEGAPETVARIADRIDTARTQDGADCALLGCAGMGAMADALAERSAIPVIDGIAASARLAWAVAG